ncbi:MAG: FAD-binding oxidoreductase [Lachnospiraceae bacterium]
MNSEKIWPMEEKYQEYLIDESKYSGYADSISFPENEKDILEIVKRMKENHKDITIQGGKTGIVGGAVPRGGHIINLSRMNQWKEARLLKDGTGLITVEPGMNLMELNKKIGREFKENPMIWPPQPTEESATVGGIAATGAKGINSFFYGDSKQYFEAVRLVCSDDSVRVITRTNEGELLNRILSTEGLPGIFSELTLRLLPKPENIWGISLFFDSQEDIGAFVALIKQDEIRAEEANILAMEYLDRTTINLIESRKKTMTKIKEVPDIESQFVGMIYMELQGTEEDIEILAEKIMEVAEKCNCDLDKAWAVSGETEIEKMRAFRHGASESANLFIEEVRRNDKRITKLSTDMEISERDFLQVLVDYEEDMKAVELNGCIFGHIKNNHLHVNILPQDYQQYQTGLELIKNWARNTKKQGGKIICEHGIGKLKKDILKDVLDEEEIGQLAKIKLEFDTKKVWNRGNVL